MTFEKVRIMGVLNVTPDSFSDGGEFFSEQRALERALEMEKSGADLIDVGAESTRPGAPPVSLSEERDRLLPLLRSLRSKTDIPISVDTTKPALARNALEEGADIINDVDGLHAAEEMASVAREFGAGLILMHRRGTPQTMQQLTQYADVVEEVFQELNQSLKRSLSSGLSLDRVVMDPGIGFSKTSEQSLEILAGLRRFSRWDRPLLVGPSRKSFIGTLIGKAPRERDWGSAAAAALAIANGAHLLRVHQVEAMADVIRVAEALVTPRSEKHVRS